MMPQIGRVIVWKDGTVMVFDESGNQMPEFQGLWEENRKAIEDKIVCSGHTVEILFNAEL